VTGRAARKGGACAAVDPPPARRPCAGGVAVSDLRATPRPPSQRHVRAGTRAHEPLRAASCGGPRRIAKQTTGSGQAYTLDVSMRDRVAWRSASYLMAEPARTCRKHDSTVRQPTHELRPRRSTEPSTPRPWYDSCSVGAPSRAANEDEIITTGGSRSGEQRDVADDHGLSSLICRAATAGPRRRSNRERHGQHDDKTLVRERANARTSMLRNNRERWPVIMTAPLCALHRNLIVPRPSTE